METPEQVVKKARPFFLGYFQKLANDLNTLIDSPVVCTLSGVSLLRGDEDLNTLFEMDRSVAFVREDGLNTGDVHLIFDVTTSIALAGMMMMMGASVIQNKIKIREYNEEIQEGFQEVSNQIVGALNDQIESKMPDGGHLILESTEHIGYGELAPTLNMETTYVAAAVEIKVADFGSASAHWLLSKGVAEAILGIKIEGSAKEQAGGASSAPAAAEGEKRSSVAPKAEGDDDAPVGGIDSVETVAFVYSSDDQLPTPDEPSGLKVIMTETPFVMADSEPIQRAIVATLQDGYRFIGVESKGVLVRVITHSDLRQVMGPFYGSKATTPRDKALFALPIGKLNVRQKLISIPADGTIAQAADLINTHNLRALPVVSNKGVLRGFIPVHAILNYYRKKKQVG